MHGSDAARQNPIPRSAPPRRVRELARAARRPLAAGLGTDDQKRQLARRFAAIEVEFSDLDDSDTRSPAKIIAMYPRWCWPRGLPRYVR